MIDRYTIKFEPAANQKEVEQLLATGEGKLNADDLKKMKARIELVGDFEDAEKIVVFVKQHAQTESGRERH
jgi:hypothetical protein